MPKRNLRDIDFNSIEKELNREDNQRKQVRERLNVFNQPNQQDHVFFEKEDREKNMGTPVKGDVLFFIRMSKPGRLGG